MSLKISLTCAKVPKMSPKISHMSPKVNQMSFNVYLTFPKLYIPLQVSPKCFQMSPNLSQMSTKISLTYAKVPQISISQNLSRLPRSTRCLLRSIKHFPKVYKPLSNIVSQGQPDVFQGLSNISHALPTTTTCLQSFSKCLSNDSQGSPNLFEGLTKYLMCLPNVSQGLLKSSQNIPNAYQGQPYVSKMSPNMT